MWAYHVLGIMPPAGRAACRRRWFLSYISSSCRTIQASTCLFSLLSLLSTGMSPLFHSSRSPIPTALTSAMPKQLHTHPARQHSVRVAVPRRRPAVKRACENCRNRKQRCEFPAKDPSSASCSKCFEAGIPCVRGAASGPTGSSLFLFFFSYC